MRFICVAAKERIPERVSIVFINLVVVFVGGALGAVSRYLLGYYVNQKAQARLPLGTLTVNLIGALLIGILTQKATVLGPRPMLFADMGFVGAFTTFSSLSYETLMLIEQGLYLEAFLNPTISVLLGLFGVSLGMLVGSAL